MAAFWHILFNLGANGKDILEMILLSMLFNYVIQAICDFAVEKILGHLWDHLLGPLWDHLWKGIKGHLRGKSRLYIIAISIAIIILILAGALLLYAIYISMQILKII